MGLVQNNLLALISQVTPEVVRGTGFGVMHFMNGISTLFANSMMGYLWKNHSPDYAFYVSMLIALVAFCALLGLVPSPRVIKRKYKI